MARKKSHAEQTGFLEIFDQAAQAQEAAHLPSDIAQGIIAYRGMIDQHHAAMMKGEFEAAIAVNEEAHRLAVKLNGGTNLGILGDDDAPACVLERETAAEPGNVPLWGQAGQFTIAVHGMHVRIDLDGIFGIGSDPVPSFSANVVDYDQPFISETGYRSFLAGRILPEPGMTPDTWAGAVIEAHIRELKGKLFAVQPQYRKDLQAGETPEADPPALPPIQPTFF